MRVDQPAYQRGNDKEREKLQKSIQLDKERPKCKQTPVDIKRQSRREERSKTRVSLTLRIYSFLPSFAHMHHLIDKM